eukprot:01595.XXX_3737_4097_1 [CDS] Oithona nana genome sequencing.
MIFFVVNFDLFIFKFVHFIGTINFLTFWILFIFIFLNCSFLLISTCSFPGSFIFSVHSILSTSGPCSFLST